jgi:hypothetical protein
MYLEFCRIPVKTNMIINDFIGTEVVIFGIPFSYPIASNSLSFTYKGETLSLTEAKQSGWWSRFGHYVYPAEFKIHDPEEFLEPGIAYAFDTEIGNAFELSLTIPYDESLEDNFFLMDINGDGLSDIMQRTGSRYSVFENSGTEWNLRPEWNTPDIVKPHFVDIDSDGLPDIVNSNNEVWLNTQQNPYLKIVHNDKGGSLELHYKKTSSLDNTGGDGISDIGFSGFVVSEITMNDGVNGISTS